MRGPNGVPEDTLPRVITTVRHVDWALTRAGGLTRNAAVYAELADGDSPHRRTPCFRSRRYG